MANDRKTSSGAVRCAVVGIGAMGKKYALMINDGRVDGLTLSAVCCTSDANVEWAKKNLGGLVAVCRGEDALYSIKDTFDAVMIVTPHRLHRQMAVRAFAEGKHVMCDKPAGISVADGEAINEAARASGKVYAMMCHQRVYPEHVKIKELLSDGAIGGITRITMENSGFFRTRFYHDSSGWRSSWTGEGGGALINQGYHLLDLWQYLFGLPQTVYANIPFGKYNDFDVDDEATLVMNYPSLTTGNFFLSTGEGVGTARLEICGTAGRILLVDKSLSITRLSCDTRDYSRSAKVTSDQDLIKTEERFTFDSVDAYKIMLENFADAVLKGEAPIAPGYDGSKTLELVNAAYLSAWKGKRVELPTDKQEYALKLGEKEAEELSKRKTMKGGNL
ncbi:MAG: Gfo/Idh/MocA family oxidoreductase [Clostridia bacterium]|nr:Gfo/Idh/MocA family oxidoreductase [Clostridia bacterium]